MERPPVVPECHENEDWAELVDQIEARPEETELTEDIDILGRCTWEKGAEGGMKIEASVSLTVVAGRSVEAADTGLETIEDEGHRRDMSSGMISVLISVEERIGVPVPEDGS